MPYPKLLRTMYVIMSNQTSTNFVALLGLWEKRVFSTRF